MTKSTNKSSTTPSSTKKTKKEVAPQKPQKQVARKMKPQKESKSTEYTNPLIPRPEQEQPKPQHQPRTDAERFFCSITSFDVICQNKNHSTAAKRLIHSPADIQLLLEGIPPNFQVMEKCHWKKTWQEVDEILLPRAPATLLQPQNRTINGNFEAALFAAACLCHAFLEGTFKQVGITRLYTSAAGSGGGNKKNQSSSSIIPTDSWICFYEIENVGFGAVARNDKAPVRLRDPVYKTLSDLILSYLPYFLDDQCKGHRVLRGYAEPFILLTHHAEEKEESRSFDRWETVDEAAGIVKASLLQDDRPVLPILTRDQIEHLTKMDKRDVLLSCTAHGYQMC